MILHTIAPRGLPRGVLFSIHEKFGVARDFREPCFFRAVERVSYVRSSVISTSSSLAYAASILPNGKMLDLQGGSSSSQKSRFAAIFGSPVFSRSRMGLARKRIGGKRLLRRQSRLTAHVRRGIERCVLGEAVVHAAQARPHHAARTQRTMAAVSSASTRAMTPI